MKNLTLGYCPMGGLTSAKPIDKHFKHLQDVSKSLERVDCVVFWGGTDVHPGLYGGKPGKFSGVKHLLKPTERDIFEWRTMLYCKANSIPMIGVCRGAQLMCAFAGGSIIQHTNGHNHNHTIRTKEGKILNVTSSHHQMMYPFDVEHEMLAWSTEKQSSFFLNSDDKAIPQMENHVEPEVVYFPKIKGLAIQGHPEWMDETEPLVEWFNGLIKEYLLCD
jgi:gamma-glutamyl-gamma-aminobutyrate hydrolase PuuD